MPSYRLHREDNEKHPTRWYSSRQEKSIANAVDGKTTKNSGATMFQPGDVVTDNWLFEAKTCTKDQKSFTLQKAWFEKNKNESVMSGKKYTSVVFNFGPNDKNNYYIVDEQTFLLMKNSMENNEIKREDTDE